MTIWAAAPSSRGVSFWLTTVPMVREPSAVPMFSRVAEMLARNWCLVIMGARGDQAFTTKGKWAMVKLTMSGLSLSSSREGSL